MALLSDPSTTTSSSASNPPLARAISLACGPLHARLNNSITSSLPLALPPKAKDTRLYAAGLSSFGMIYLTYEDLWESVAHNSFSNSLPGVDSTHAVEVAGFFATLRPKGIERSPRLRKDQEYLDTKDESACDTTTKRKEGPAQRRFRHHIKHSLTHKPHTLYAYAWCMYMAVFAGGRYIREDLADVGDKFWRHHGHSEDDDYDESSSEEEADHEQDPLLASISHSSNTSNPAMNDSKRSTITKKKHKRAPLDRLGYSFLSFDGSDDGAAIQDSFKQNLHAAEDLFTPAEKDEVVAESRAIFELTIDLVKEMDKRIRPDNSSSPPEILAPALVGESGRILPPYTPSSSTSNNNHNEIYTAYADASPLYHEKYHDNLLTQRASTPELLEWRDPPPRHGVIFWIKMVLLVTVSTIIGWSLLVGMRFYLWHLAGWSPFERHGPGQRRAPCLG